MCLALCVEKLVATSLEGADTHVGEMPLFP